MEGVLAILMVFGIPLSGIWSYTYLKAKKMNMQSGTLSGGDKRLLSEVLEENRQLKHRLENLELIVSESNLLDSKYN